jgi:hypothetical protein
VALGSQFVEEMAFGSVRDGQVTDDDSGPVIAQVAFDDAETPEHMDARLMGDAHDGVMPEVRRVIEVSHLHGKLVLKLVVRLCVEFDARHAPYLPQMRPAGQEKWAFNFFRGSSITQEEKDHQERYASLTEISDLLRLRIKIGSPGPLPEGKVTPGPSRITVQLPDLSQARLPFEIAVREVARAVTSYIAANKLALQDAYTSYVAELYGELPIPAPTEEGVTAMPSMARMTFVEGLSTALLTKIAQNPYALSDSPLGLSGQFQLGNKIVLLDEVDTLNQVLEKILTPVLRAQPLLVARGQDTSRQEVQVAELPSAPIQKFIAGWRLSEGTISRLEQNPLSGISAEGELATGQRALGIMGVDVERQAEARIGIREASPGKSTVPFGPSASPPALEGSTRTDPAGRISSMPDRVRVDLTGILGGRAELIVRYDAAVITSKIAVLLEQVNSLIRASQAQASLQRSNERTPRGLNTSLDKAIDSILSLVILQNKAFRDAASLGITMGKEKLFALDPATLKAALETNREEAVAVLRAVAGSFQEQMSLYVDPRAAAALIAAAGGHPIVERARGRGRKNRWEKKREGLEKRMLELGMLFEYSEGLRDWFQKAVEMLIPEVGPSGGAALVSRGTMLPIGTMLPAKELPGDLPDDDSLGMSSSPGAEGALQQFVRLTTASLDADSGEPCIKLLLERRTFVETFRDAEVTVGPEIAELCLRNEKSVLRRLDEERRVLLSQMEELSRNIQVAKGYTPHFPFPPMPAFISSKG